MNVQPHFPSYLWVSRFFTKNLNLYLAWFFLVTTCSHQDIIIFGTDGVTDNLDPVIACLAIPQSPDISFADESPPTLKDCDDANSKGPFSSTRHIWTSYWSSIPTPHDIPVWPKPPSPPPPPTHPLNGSATSNCHGKLSCLDGISACSLNYTDQLELSWSERRQYAAKELTRLWYELEQQQTSEGLGDRCFIAESFAETLLNHARRVTAQKRQFLEAPETTRLKAQFSRYARKKNSKESLEGKGADLDLKELDRRKAWVMDRLKRLPGKLDHATVVVLQVGREGTD